MVVTNNDHIRRLQDAVLALIEQAEAPIPHILDMRRSTIRVFDREIRFVTRARGLDAMCAIAGKVFFVGFTPNVREAEWAEHRDR